MSARPAFIVIDTNVLISAGLLPRSRMARLVALAVANFVIAQNEATWEELISRIEREKFDRYFGDDGRLKFMSGLAQLVQFFDSVATVQVSRDPDDDKFIGLAMDARASLIVSGDADLQDLRSYQGISIVSPSAFLEQFDT